MQVKTKHENFRLLEQGSFGNKLRIWNSIDEIIESGYKGTVSMRYKDLYGGSFYAYDVPILKIEDTQDTWMKKGAEKENIVFNESAPDHLLLIQGELMWEIYPYYLLYSLEREKKMNDALKYGKHASGLTALNLLKGCLNPSSYSDMMALLELYPDSVIEFSAYSISLGDIPGRNTIIWEVRNY